MGQLVPGISPTSFIVKTGAARQSVRRYVVDEYECKVALSTGFVLCLDSKEPADSEAAFVQAIRSYDGLRRQKDRWAVLKLAPQKRPAAEVPPDSFVISSRSRYAILNVDEITTPVRTAAAFQETLDARYTGAPDQIEAMFKHAPLLLSGLAGDRGVKTALETLLQVGGGWTNPHLVFLGASASPYLIEELLAKGTRPAATVHVIAQSAASKTQEVRRIVELTGGLYREPKDAAGLESACVEICSSLQHHYTVRWKQESIDAVELEIVSELAGGRRSIRLNGPQSPLASLPAFE